jgi:hypothetical protein
MPKRHRSNTKTTLGHRQPVATSGDETTGLCIVRSRAVDGDVRAMRVLSSVCLAETLRVPRIHKSASPRRAGGRAGPAGTAALAVEGLGGARGGRRGGRRSRGGRADSGRDRCRSRRGGAPAAACRAGQADGGRVRRRLAVAHARVPVGNGLARAGDGLKVDDGVVAKHGARGHDVKVVAVPVLVRAARLRAPHLVAVVRTQVGHHDDDALARHAARATAVARRGPRRRQVVALAASGTAPACPGRVEQCLRRRRRVHAVTDAELRASID